MRGETWIADVILGLDLSSLSATEEVWFTYKRDANKDSDARALVQISLSGGLVRLNGEEVVDSTLTSLTVTDGATGTVRLYVSHEATTLLAILQKAGEYDFTVLLDSYGKLVRKSGALQVTAAVTRAIEVV